MKIEASVKKTRNYSSNLKPKVQGWELVSMRSIIQDETENISEYIRKMAHRNKMLSQHLRQQQKTDGGEQLEQSWEDKQEQGLVLGPLPLCLLAPTWGEI